MAMPAKRKSSAANQQPDFRSDYDGAWKEGLKRRLNGFLDDYFPRIAARIDWGVEPVWQDRELEQVLARLGKGNPAVDLLVKLQLKDGDEQSFLLHIEVQSSKESGFERRVHLYHSGIFFAFGIRAATLAVLADLNRDWAPGEDRWELEDFQSVLRFPTCKLIEKLDNEWKNQHTIPIELARAQIAALRTAGDQAGRFRAKMNLMKSVYALGYTADDVREIYALIDHMMLLSEDLQLRFRQEIIEFETTNSMPYVTSIERLAREEGREQGREQGREEGREEGRDQTTLKLTQRMLARFFGPIPDSLAVRLGELDVEQLEQLLDAAPDLGSHEDVAEWLNR